MWETDSGIERDGPEEGKGMAAAPTEVPTAVEGSTTDPVATTPSSLDWLVEVVALPLNLGLSATWRWYHEKGFLAFTSTSKCLGSIPWSWKYSVRKLG